MIAFVEKLMRRKVEIERETGSEWQALVVRLTDEQEADADATLAELERLGRSIDELQAATKLLSQRRGWSALVASGVSAEAEHPRVVKAIQAEVAAFARLEERHDAILRPLHGSERAAVQCLADAAQAKTDLLRTATDPLRLAAVRDTDEKLTTLRRERAEFDRALRGAEDRVRELTSQSDPDLNGHIQRLKSEIEAMQSHVPSFHERGEKLAAECEAARGALLMPEAI